ncbi:aerotolerance regulator BatD [Leptospira langatensis]|uniref:Aerotolerance regulator BatD n=1 Tax=Leptospira langatensis TaxID=2484983 RepID=A0A5F1ZPR8_9LEPT|nr:BatD family protein [Leptospira langatensis]TGK01954.1 aerotolerance regulator BatD [Leptospira langatensis]TGL39310.1 aerotolerance regulator BatD [Leptospira langatensis]
MKRFLLLFIFGFASVSSVYAVDPKFYLSQSRAELGDPVFAIIETEGAAQIRVIDKEFQAKGIKAVYWGMEDSTTIVNFKTFRKKLLKYRLIASAPGKYTVPEITIEIDGKKFETSSLTVEFGARSAAARNPGSFWNRFFTTEDNAGPADGDLKVVFQLDKKEVWVGQPILGFFALYYRNAIRPYFDRDPSSSIEFPYFRSEVLSGISLTIPNTVVYEGIEYETSPYNKEIFILTPLKKGEYSLGSTSFHLEGQLQSYFHMRSTKTIGSKITVQDLPQPSPKTFAGAVGDFEISLEGFPKNIHTDEPFQFKVVLKGKGNLSSVKDPLRSSCPSPDCYPEITFLQLRPQREFKELGPGEYGFYLNHSYSYSVLPKKEGTWKPKDLQFSYFNPNLRRYSEVTISFPSLTVGPPRPKIKTSEGGVERGYGISFWGISLLGISGLAGTLYIALVFRRRYEITRSLKRLDLWIGSKRGFVLKHAAMSKGLSEEEGIVLASCKSESVPLDETYRSMDPDSRASLLGIAHKLLVNIKEEESV